MNNPEINDNQRILDTDALDAYVEMLQQEKSDAEMRAIARTTPVVIEDFTEEQVIIADTLHEAPSTIDDLSSDDYRDSAGLVVTNAIHAANSRIKQKGTDARNRISDTFGLVGETLAKNKRNIVIGVGVVAFLSSGLIVDALGINEGNPKTDAQSEETVTSAATSIVESPIVEVDKPTITASTRLPAEEPPSDRVSVDSSTSSTTSSTVVVAPSTTIEPDVVPPATSVEASPAVIAPVDVLPETPLAEGNVYKRNIPCDAESFPLQEGMWFDKIDKYVVENCGFVPGRLLASNLNYGPYPDGQSNIPIGAPIYLIEGVSPPPNTDFHPPTTTLASQEKTSTSTRTNGLGEPSSTKDCGSEHLVQPGETASRYLNSKLPSGMSIGTVITSNGNTMTIYEHIQKQYPDLGNLIAGNCAELPSSSTLDILYG